MSAPDEDDLQSLFNEPGGFYAEQKPATNVEYTMLDGHILRLRLVGQNPLWGHLLWNAGRALAEYFEQNPQLIRGKRILEFGAGAALPSVMCALVGAETVLATDYPDAELIENIEYNIANASPRLEQCQISASGFLWGSSTDHVLSYTEKSKGFDVLVLADVVFNHSEHEKLLKSLKATMAPGGCAYVWFTPYRPWLLEADLRFFDLARASGLAVVKMQERMMDEVLFKNDAGDETLRRTVFAYKITSARMLTSR